MLSSIVTDILPAVTADRVKVTISFIPACGCGVFYILYIPKSLAYKIYIMYKNLVLHITLTILLVCITAFRGAFAQNIHKAEISVQKVVEQLKNAMLSGNRADLESVAAEKLSYGHSNGTVDDKKQFVEKIASGQSDFVTIELRNQQVTVSGKTAIVRHELHAQINDNGKPGEVHLRVMLVFQQQGKYWKLLGRQSIRI